LLFVWRGSERGHVDDAVEERMWVQGVGEAVEVKLESCTEY
jgi:hypothetical protein